MISHLSILNFTIVESVDLSWGQGLSVITGETGAGKSIAMEALHFALGAKSDVSVLRNIEQECRVTLTFIIEEGHKVLDLLHSWGIPAEGEIILVRTLSPQGRSQFRMNGVISSLNQIKELATVLVDLHGQHAHQKLLKQDAQRGYLDSFAGHSLELASYKNSLRHYATHVASIKKSKELGEQAKQLRDLVGYQLAELDELSPQNGELSDLEEQFNILSQAESLLITHQHAQNVLIEQEENPLLKQVELLIKFTSDLEDAQPAAKQISERLIAVNEECKDIQRELSRMAEKVELNPEALHEVSSRIDTYRRMAKKHSVSPYELYEHYVNLQSQSTEFESNTELLHAMEQELPSLLQSVKVAAEQLTFSRRSAAARLTDEIQKALPSLNLPHARFVIDISPSDNFLEHGSDHIEFLFSANQGQSPAGLSKTISGGELSRLSLALQVAVAGKAGADTLIFDEVDVGISGSTASAVGKLLRTLGKNTQVISITHLPQVAACANHHLLVEKIQRDGSTTSSIKPLNRDERINELARLLGAHSITDAARNNAKELLSMGEAA